MNPIANFARVDDDLWRGARPNAAGIAWLLTQGAKTIINLEWEQSDERYPGITEVRLADWEPLPLIAPVFADHHIRSFLAAVHAAAKPVFVHCRSGENRTGVAVAAYRIIVKGDPIDAVIAEFQSYHGLWIDADLTYIRSLEARKAEFV